MRTEAPKEPFASYWQETVAHFPLSNALPSRVDVTVIGGGVLGAAMCYWLAKAGAAVCLLFYDPVVQAIGVAHAGWRGTARGIALATVATVREQFGCDPAHLYAGIGPSIGPCCYEVSEDVRQVFLGQRQFEESPTEERYRALVASSAVFEMGKVPQKASLRLNMWETNRQQLLLAGLLPEQIELPEVCTSCATERFFSYRAEQGCTGRFPAMLALRSSA